LHLLSGDNDAEKKVLSTFFEKGYLQFRQSPEDKLNYVKALKSKGKKVLMVGDGLNDAGALKQSDVGIAVSENVYTFSPACDAILDSKSFNKLARFADYSRDSMKVIYASFAISFLYNIAGISVAATGLLTPLFAAILMPLSSVTVVAFVTLATGIFAKRSNL